MHPSNPRVSGSMVRIQLLSFSTQSFLMRISSNTWQAMRTLLVEFKNFDARGVYAERAPNDGLIRAWQPAPMRPPGLEFLGAPA